MEECRRTAEKLASLCGTPGGMEIQKHLEDLDTAAEEIQDGVRDRELELVAAMDKAERFDHTLQVRHLPL